MDLLLDVDGFALTPLIVLFLSKDLEKGDGVDAFEWLFLDASKSFEEENGSSSGSASSEISWPSSNSSNSKAPSCALGVFREFLELGR